MHTLKCQADLSWDQKLEDLAGCVPVTCPAPVQPTESAGWGLSYFLNPASADSSKSLLSTKFKASCPATLDFGDADDTESFTAECTDQE